MPTLTKNLKTYSTLLRQVKETLVVGQQRIEQEKVKTYWETGRLIAVHILQFKERADYGNEVVERLSKDIHISTTVLHRCVKFARQYPRSPIVASRPQFSWSHYRQLIAIPDNKRRSLLEEKVQKNSWTADELAARIKEERPESREEAAVETSKPSQKLLTPARGTLYTYKIVKRQALGGQDTSSELLVDLGFGIFRNVEARLLANFSENQIVESRPKEDAYKFVAGTRTAKDLFTYQAFIEKVIDADTLKVRFDLGFDTWTRQILRLRGINCPEMSTSAGAAAKVFVQSHLKDAPMVVVHSSRSDKYDRYLADIFISTEGKEDIYLNNLLLEYNHAVRMDS